MATGKLIVNVYVDNESQPLKDALVKIEGEGESIEKTTDNSGQTEIVTLKCVSEELSLEPQDADKPYSQFKVTVSTEGVATVVLNGVVVMENQTSIQNVILRSTNKNETIVDIEDNNLWAG